jgi:hypothetical protein
VPVLPDAERPAASRDSDPLLYLRSAVGFLLGGGAVVALVLALTGAAPAPRALLLAGLLWTLFGLLTGLVDFVLAPLAEWIGGRLGGLRGGGRE